QARYQGFSGRPPDIISVARRQALGRSPSTPAIYGGNGPRVSTRRQPRRAEIGPWLHLSAQGRGRRAISALTRYGARRLRGLPANRESRPPSPHPSPLLRPPLGRGGRPTPLPGFFSNKTNPLRHQLERNLGRAVALGARVGLGVVAAL